MKEVGQKMYKLLISHISPHLNVIQKSVTCAKSSVTSGRRCCTLIYASLFPALVAICQRKRVQHLSQGFGNRPKLFVNLVRIIVGLVIVVVVGALLVLLLSVVIDVEFLNLPSTTLRSNK